MLEVLAEDLAAFLAKQSSEDAVNRHEDDSLHKQRLAALVFSLDADEVILAQESNRGSRRISLVPS